MRASRAVDILHGTLMFLGVGGCTSAYWIAFFSSNLTIPAGRQGALTNEEYMAFQAAFPLPDAAMAACFAIAGVLLWGGDRAAPFWALLASGMMLFLALIDVNFNLIHGMYATIQSDPAIQIEAAINAGCVAFALWTAARMWNHPLRIEPPSA